MGLSRHTFMLLSELHWLRNCSFYFTPLLQKRLACVASVSAWVRRESWEESKKRNDGGRGGDTCIPILVDTRTKYKQTNELTNVLMSLHLSQATEFSARKWLYVPHLKISQFRHLKRIYTSTYNKPLVAVFLRGKETVNCRQVIGV